MSKTNKGRDNRITEREEDVDRYRSNLNQDETGEFEFYNKFAKSMVLKLVDSKDKALGAQWLRLLGANRNSKGAVIGVKLLILCLSRGFLSSPFDQPAPNDVSLFEQDGLNEMDLAYMFLSAGKNEKEVEVANPPITTSLSSDFCQYVAVQEIPRFGIHCYFATSSESIDKWNLPPGRVVMDADIANPLAWEKCMAKISACMPSAKKNR